MTDPELAHVLAMQTLREAPPHLDEAERFARVCMAIACDFPAMPVDTVMALSSAAMITWRRGT